MHVGKIDQGVWAFVVVTCSLMLMIVTLVSIITHDGATMNSNMTKRYVACVASGGNYTDLHSSNSKGVGESNGDTSVQQKTTGCSH